LTAHHFQAQNSPRGEAPPACRCSIRFCLSRQKNRPAEPLFWNPRRAGASEKKASRKLNHIDMPKMAETRHLGKKA
jgi:hypothetical protein